MKLVVKSVVNSMVKNLDAPKIKLVAVCDCTIGRRVCFQGEVVEVYEVVAYKTFQCSEPRAKFAPGESFKTDVDKLEKMAAAWDVDEVYGDSASLGDVEDLYKSERDEAVATAKASIGVRGPAVKVTAARDGRIAGCRVKAGEAIVVAEAHAVDAMLAGVAERRSSLLTREGLRYLNRAVDEYVPPDPHVRSIPKIKVVATCDSALIGGRVAMKGEVVEIPEDVAYVLLRQTTATSVLLPVPSPDASHREFRLAPGARFTMSDGQLEEAAKRLYSGGGVASVL